jgi:hypothetical protein
MNRTEAHDKVDVHTTKFSSCFPNVRLLRTSTRAWCIAIALVVAVVLAITALMTSRSSFDMAIATKAHVKGRCAIYPHIHSSGFSTGQPTQPPFEPPTNQSYLQVTWSAN